jgi:hypothetical protein
MRWERAGQGDIEFESMSKVTGILIDPCLQGSQIDIDLFLEHDCRLFFRSECGRCSDDCQFDSLDMCPRATLYDYPPTQTCFIALANLVGFTWRRWTYDKNIVL